MSSVEQAFVGRDEKRGPLKTPAWELATYVLGMGNSILEIRITGSSCRPQLTTSTAYVLKVNIHKMYIDTVHKNVLAKKAATMHVI